MLRIGDLDFSYPNNLVALEAKPRGTSRILFISKQEEKFFEISWSQFLDLFHKGDVLVLNDSKVLWARLVIKKTSGALGEIFFLKEIAESSLGLNSVSPIAEHEQKKSRWKILSRAMNLKVGKKIELPGGITAEVLIAGRVSEIELSEKIDLPEYFLEHGDVPLPPYITLLRDSRLSSDINIGSSSSENFSAGVNLSTKERDQERYQTAWASKWGSVAAPTAGLHFSQEHLDILKKRGVQIAYVTLHVGAGTFLPIEVENLDDFQIHSEFVEVSEETCHAVNAAKARGSKVWACGTTATRALETAARSENVIKPFSGETNLFIKPGFQFQVVDHLLTNFHQPKSSLLALVSAFASQLWPKSELVQKNFDFRKAEKESVQKILRAYEFAIREKFRLFSYGDLTMMG